MIYIIERKEKREDITLQKEGWGRGCDKNTKVQRYEDTKGGDVTMMYLIRIQNDVECDSQIFERHLSFSAAIAIASELITNQKKEVDKLWPNTDM